MGLASATASDDVILLGVGEPYAYDAGVMEGRAYPAGLSQRICVGSLDGRDFYVMKLKTAEVHALADVLNGAQRGIRIRVTYTAVRGAYQVKDIVLL